MLVHVIDGAVEKGDPLVELRVEGVVQKTSEAEDDADDGHALKGKEKVRR